MANRCCEYDSNDEYYDAHDTAPCAHRQERPTRNCSTPIRGRRDLTPYGYNNPPSPFRISSPPSRDTTSKTSCSLNKKRSTSPSRIPLSSCSRKGRKQEIIAFSSFDDDANCRAPCSTDDLVEYEFVECPSYQKIPTVCRNDVNDSDSEMCPNDSYFNRIGSMGPQNQMYNSSDFSITESACPYFQSSEYECTSIINVSSSRPQSAHKSSPPFSPYSRRPRQQDSCQNSFCTNSSIGNMSSTYGQAFNSNKRACPLPPPCLSTAPERNNQISSRNIKALYTPPKASFVEDKPACCRTKEGSNSKPDCCKKDHDTSPKRQSRPLQDPTVFNRPCCPPPPPCESLRYCVSNRLIPCFTSAESTESIASKKTAVFSDRLKTKDNMVSKEIQVNGQRTTSEDNEKRKKMKTTGKESPEHGKKVAVVSDSPKTKDPFEENPLIIQSTISVDLKKREKARLEKERRQKKAHSDESGVKTPSDKVKVKKTPSGKVKKTPSDKVKVKKTPSGRVKKKTSSGKIRNQTPDKAASEKSLEEEKKVEVKNTEDPKEDGIKLLGVTISTVMLLATDSKVPENYSSWSAKYLKCIKNCKGQHPPNVKKFLQMLGVREDELLEKQDKPCFCADSKQESQQKS